MCYSSAPDDQLAMQSCERGDIVVLFAIVLSCRLFSTEHLLDGSYDNIGEIQKRILIDWLSEWVQTNGMRPRRQISLSLSLCLQSAMAASIYHRTIDHRPETTSTDKDRTNRTRCLESSAEGYIKKTEYNYWESDKSVRIPLPCHARNFATTTRTSVENFFRSVLLEWCPLPNNTKYCHPTILQ